MRVTRISQLQQSPAVASNPANGINNIPLTGSMETQSLTSEEIIKVLNQITSSEASNAEQYQSSVEDLISRSQNPRIQDQLKRLLNSLSMTKNPHQQTIDPATGQPDPNAADIAKQLVEEIKQMTKNEKKSQISYQINLRTAAEAPAPHKKKSRGNPFRVLMGKVGKLLDHGLEKSTIIREIKKRINFDEDTISRCVDIVRDYNKKKNKTKKESSTVFNAARYAQAQYTTETNGKSIYNVKPEYAKRSTAELMARASWLSDLQDMGKKAADNTGVATELKAIRTALKERGFSDKELES